ncbi:hypothetical protein ALC57_01748 [Trachymyrmex cornetzi]|uniref:Uncharacterized protein n=1 Tax=Trachymyrmex cornetzi TaxID=471704 RepID=A0A195EKJ0_9HYME|nr:hypothetical protein ALC57_01748 [Trachymyrmex cornetzi]
MVQPKGKLFKMKSWTKFRVAAEGQREISVSVCIYVRTSSNAFPPNESPSVCYLHTIFLDLDFSTSTGFRFLSTSDLRGPPSGRQKERMERWNSPAEKEARRERKTGSALKVSEKGGWIVHRESVRKKDGRVRHRDGRHTAGKGRGDEGDMPAGVHRSAGGAGGDGGGGRSDLTRLAGRNKLATRALVPSVPLAIGGCRFLSRTGDVSIGLTDSFLHRRDPIDLLFCHPFPPYNRTSFDFMVAR